MVGFQIGDRVISFVIYSSLQTERLLTEGNDISGAITPSYGGLPRSGRREEIRGWRPLKPIVLQIYSEPTRDNYVNTLIVGGMELREQRAHPALMMRTSEWPMAAVFAITVKEQTAA